MKRLAILSAITIAPVLLSAQEAVDPTASEAEAPSAVQEESVVRATDSVWPAFFSVWEWPANPDVVGLRLTVPFSTRQEHVTGIDLGFWGRTLSFEGIQISLLRNDVKDRCAGFQIGCYNSIGSGEMLGLQIGLWNEANALRGIQVGLVNVTGETQGLQVGLINRAESMYGYQVGLVNVIREAELQFLPIINIGF